MTIKECYDRMNGSYEEAKSRLMMDSMIERFVFKFLDDSTMENLRKAIAQGDIAVSFREAHTLKGVAANLAFTELQKAASDAAKRAGQLRPLQSPADAELMAGVEKAYGIVVDAIRTYQAEK